MTTSIYYILLQIRLFHQMISSLAPFLKYQRLTFGVSKCHVNSWLLICDKRSFSSGVTNDPSHLHLEAARARPHRDLVHLPLAAPGPGGTTAPAAAAAALALPVLPSFTVTAATASAAASGAAPGAAPAAVVAARVVLLAPEARPEAAPELVHPARPLFEVLQVGEERRRVKLDLGN